MSPSHLAVEVFCSYAHEDKKYRKQLESHLSTLKRQELISLWHDRQVRPGANWAEAIDAHLESASVIVLLISADFIASDYCYGIEMKRALERYEANEAQVIPILVHPCSWRQLPIGKLQALPKGAKPISTWKPVHKGWEQVIEELQFMIEGLSSTSCAALSVIRNIPYQRNPVFTGREQLLAQLADALRPGEAVALSQPHIQAISGLGGIGKTQIAIEYAYRHWQDYEAIFWISADTTESLNAGYVEIARLLDLPERNGQDQRLIVKAVQTWLEKNSRWLLILDNADELAEVDEFIPHCCGGHILLTTQAQSTGRRGQPLKVEVMDGDEGALLLLRRAGLIAPQASLEAVPFHTTLAREITQELGGLPLALDQAGAYVEETLCGLSAYLRDYRTQRVELLNTRGDSVKDHPEPVDKTLLLSFARVEQKNPSAADLLRLCAFLAPDVIPEAIIPEGPSHLGPLLASVSTNSHLLNQAIKTLLRYSLIHRETSHVAGNLLSVHRLVQVVLKEQMDEQSKKAWAERAVHAVYAALPPVRHENWPQWERIVLHVQLCAQHIEHYGIQFKEAAALLHQTGWYLTERAQYEDAEQWYRRSLRIFEQGLGPDYLDVAYSLRSLANVCSELGKYEEAEELYKRSLRIFEQNLGRDHLEVAPLLNNLAILSKVQGRYDEAEERYKHSLRIWWRSRRTEILNFAQSLNNLAVLYAEQGGKYATAVRLFKRSLHIREQSLEPDHPDIAQSLNNLANLYTEPGGKYAMEAEKLYRRSLDIRERSLGPDHPDVAYSLNGLAILYAKQGKYVEAEKLYQHSQSIWEQSLRPDHPQVAYSLNNLAVLYSKQSKYDEAEPLCRSALVIFEQSLGSEHLHTRRCAKNCVDLLRILKRDAEALELERRYLSSA